MIEERLNELSIQLSSLYNQLKLNKSPGLVEAITRLETKVDNFKMGIDFWRQMQKVYPNYDR